MSFITIEYYIFLILVVGVIYLIKQKYNWIILLTASYIFYASIHSEYALIMLASTIVAYFSAIMMSRVKKGRFFFFIIGITTDLSLLFFFKYFNFFVGNFNELFQTDFNTEFSLLENIILPIGISFYTFQSLSYTIDVFRNKITPEKHFGYYALYISFFPQLVAGPIEHSQFLIPQLKTKTNTNLDQIIQGGKLIIWGLFKKIVIADTIGSYSNNIYSNPSDYNSIETALAIYAFAFQVYYDFSGYSNIAVGSAKMLGIDLSMNFNNPLTSKSITELWKKWHITLMTFLKTYIYKPLIRKGRLLEKSKLSAIFLVFFISGLWHGASWGYIMFGVINGLFVIIERIYRLQKNDKVLQKRNNPYSLLSFCSVFYVVTILSISTIWFKTSNNIEVFTMLNNVFKLNLLNTATLNVFYILFLMILGVWLETYRKNYQLPPIETIKNHYGRIATYALITILIVLYSSQEDITFIYYQF